MTHAIHNVAWKHAYAARTALDTFRDQHAESRLAWISFDAAVELLDLTIKEPRRPLHGLPPALLASCRSGSPAPAATARPTGYFSS
ncbi:MAG: hypothetical protein ACYC0X_21960 [Pirellulaceae bacterium]